MKAKRFLQYLLVNDISWALLSPFLFVSRRIEASRINFKNRRIENENVTICKNIFKEKTVLHGMFKGMRYADIQATGSSVYAKLLGSYELEIASALKAFLKKKYATLINIGCDEGYYAVGITILCPHIHVYAFDCNKKAQVRCKLLAQTNNVSDRISVNGCFAISELPQNIAISKNLFIIDCEGCENELFTEKLIGITKNADLIIELHYQKHPLVLSKIENLLSHTHKITLLTALSDHERIMHYQFDELNQLTYQQKHFILNERNGFMQWLIAESIN